MRGGVFHGTGSRLGELEKTFTEDARFLQPFSMREQWSSCEQSVNSREAIHRRSLGMGPAILQPSWLRTSTLVAPQINHHNSQLQPMELTHRRLDRFWIRFEFGVFAVFWLECCESRGKSEAHSPESFILIYPVNPIED